MTLSAELPYTLHLYIYSHFFASIICIVQLIGLENGGKNKSHSAKPWSMIMSLRSYSKIVEGYLEEGHIWDRHIVERQDIG
jgi:hypothetical protein